MEAWTTIRYLQAQGVGIRAICRQLGVSRTAVRRVLRGDGPSQYQRPARPNQQLVRYEAQIHAWYFGQHLIGSRIVRELRKLGYTGGATAVYAYLKQVRAAAPSGKATVRFETPPGRQGQFDWSPYTVDLGGELTKVIVFGMTLGYSRRKHYPVSLDETQASIFEAILDQAKATDTWNEFQANSLKRHVNLHDAAQIRILGRGTPAEANANKQAASLEQAVNEKYQPAQGDLMPKALDLEHERDLAEARHRGFQTSEAAFQLGIVLSSISIVARARWLLLAGSGLGLLGLLLGANALVQIVPPL